MDAVAFALAAVILASRRTRALLGSLLRIALQASIRPEGGGRAVVVSQVTWICSSWLHTRSVGQRRRAWCKVDLAERSTPAFRVRTRQRPIEVERVEETFQDHV